ncbi:MAG: sugar nucleotide-binding protein [Planctomycetales bacterium]|nr:sugar nucleotide-binding protein [Planctomycetales bacterium]
MICRVENLPDPPLPLLITGISGVSGYNALHYFQKLYPGQVVGIRQKSNWPLRGKAIVPCDAEDTDGLRRLFDRYGFRAVLNCGGNCALKSCELDPDMAWRINLLPVRVLLDAMAGHDVRFVHLSIDLVFSGQRGGNHVESDYNDPVTVYGKTMAAAEHLVELAKPEACILRISLPMGISYSGHAGAIDWIQARFKANKPATLYFDEVRTPTYTDCLNRVCQAVLASDVSGVHHCGGPRKLSLFQIAQVVNRVGGYNPNNLMGCYREEAGPIPPRAGNVTMVSNKLANVLGFQPFDPWPFDDRFAPTHSMWHAERSPSEEFSPELLARVLYRNPGCVL